MTSTQDSSKFTITAEILKVLQQNLGCVFDQTQLTAVLDAKIVAPELPFGQIRSLTYIEDGTLGTVTIDDITFTSLGTSEGDDQRVVIVCNLQDFQTRLEEAANYGHRVGLTINLETHRIASLSLSPNQSVENSRFLVAGRGCIQGYNCPPNDPFYRG